MEARKAPRLDLYAYAQARAGDLLKSLPHCKNCDGKNCKAPDRPVLGRTGWPTCPVRMISSGPWAEVVRLYRAAQISPLDGFPRCLTAVGFDAMLELKDAVAREDERQIEEIKRKGGPK